MLLRAGRVIDPATGSDGPRDVLVIDGTIEAVEPARSVRASADVPVIDAINAVRGPRPEGFESLAEHVQSLPGGPVAKAFNTNFATLYDRLAAARAGAEQAQVPGWTHAPVAQYAAQEAQITWQKITCVLRLVRKCHCRRRN